MESITWILIIIVSGSIVWGFIQGYTKPRAQLKSDTDRWGRDDNTPPEKGQDNWERFNFHSAKIIPAKGRYHIQYTDQRGMPSERDVTIKRVYEADGKYAMDAFCHWRGEHRTFVDDRITSATDLDTGEIVASTAKHATGQYTDSGEGKAFQAIGREWVAASLLSFVCRADGRMMKAERNVVADYLKRHCPDIRQDDQALDEAIKTIGAPEPRDYKRLIANMKHDGEIERLRDIFDCAKRIVATQKTIDPMEKAALDILENALK